MVSVACEGTVLSGGGGRVAGVKRRSSRIRPYVTWKGGVEPISPLQNTHSGAGDAGQCKPDVGSSGGGGQKPVFKRARNDAQGAAAGETDGHRVPQNVPGRKRPCAVNQAWHILGECSHRDLRDARVKSAKELQEKARDIFLRKIKNKAGRLPHWWLLFAISSDDK
jgi:hypothetical protein